MNPNQALWEKGDFTQIAATMRESGEALVRDLGITSGMKVLDLGCGDGTTAIPSAQLGADVLGVDIASNLVEAGNRRAQELGLTNVPLPAGRRERPRPSSRTRRFDLTSASSARCSPRSRYDVAKEMVRVTKPGGRVVMGNWIPGDPTLVAQILKISSAYSPPPPEGFVSPMTWGVEDNVVERFTAAGVPARHIAFAARHVHVRLPRPPAELVAAFRDYYGPTMNAFDAARADGRERRAAGASSRRCSRSHNTRRATGTAIPATFLRVTVNR